MEYGRNEFVTNEILKARRDAALPVGLPSKSGVYVARNGARVLVANIMGRVFMHPELDDPFQAAERILAEEQVARA